MGGGPAALAAGCTAGRQRGGLGVAADRGRGIRVRSLRPLFWAAEMARGQGQSCRRILPAWSSPDTAQHSPTLRPPSRLCHLRAQIGTPSLPGLACRPVVLKPQRMDFVTFQHRGRAIAPLPQLRGLPAVPSIS